MPELKPLTALGAAAPRTVSHGPVELLERCDVALASLALRRGVVRPQPFGLALPEPGHWTAAGGIGAWWASPEQWMIEAEGRAAEDFAAAVAEAAPGCPVTEQTDGFAMFDIVSQAGTAPLDAMLSRLVNIDPAGFLPGNAVRTWLEHMACFVIRRSEARLSVLGPRSAAGSLWHALETAAKRQKHE